LNPDYDESLSHLALNCNLRRYIVVRQQLFADLIEGLDARGAGALYVLLTTSFK
jgi:hypothetical protein